MNSSECRLLEKISQELRLPEINADACVHTLCNESDCHDCVTACPTDAWVLEDDNLGLDIDACNGCGLCIPACQSGALHIDLPWVIRSLGPAMIALFACDKTQLNESDAIIPCINVLGIRQLLQLNNVGIRYLLIATEDCNKCLLYSAENIYTRMEQINNLLIERDKPAMKILQRSNQAWKNIFHSDEAINRGTQLSRRNFLRGGSRQFRQQLLVMDPINLPEYRTIPQGQLLPKSKNKDIKWPWLPSLDQQLCNGCDACFKLCPTDALQLVRDEEKNVLYYKINPVNCTGCGICSSVCELKAINITPWSYSEIDTINLYEKDCTACGNSFHLPEQNSLPELELCRICSSHNHSSILYQVLN